MKSLLKGFIMFAMTFIFMSCATIDSKERGVEISYGGKANLTKVYEPGIHWGLHWVVDHMETYDVSQQTLVEKYSFNDNNNMETGVEIAVDFNLDPSRVNTLHVNINDWMIKLQKTIKSAAKEVIPQYTASDLNLTERAQAEVKLTKILEEELPVFYLICARVQITDVDIPEPIAKAAEQTAKQREVNKLALSKAIEAENNFKAAEWDAKTKDILSQPAMLKLKELDIEMAWAQKGVSRYGNHNVFGVNAGILLNK